MSQTLRSRKDLQAAALRRRRPAPRLQRSRTSSRGPQPTRPSRSERQIGGLRAIESRPQPRRPTRPSNQRQGTFSSDSPTLTLAWHLVLHTRHLGFTYTYTYTYTIAL